MEQILLTLHLTVHILHKYLNEIKLIFALRIFKSSTKYYESQ